ncbi:PQQ-binding-like beta-propeller repeat protein [Ruania zhangjianzhongii]|uniref:outer membrane protein assembly factor BamB family protein n=1 Tax=Ruania zhangjianzhongii TaxID=2603206 RepID=UPI00143CF901|nr:hypothetical protein [Ruania zhangjianzhongii]
MSTIGLVAGLGLAAWAVVEPQLTRYIVGVVLLAASVAALLYRWRRQRVERTEPGGGARWRFRLSAGGLSAAVAVLLAGVALAVPYLDHRSETEDGVIWRADRFGGQVAVAAGTAFVTDRPDGEVTGAVDLDDGSLEWSIPDGRWLTQEGDVIAADADGLRYYSSAGEQLWEFDVDGGQEAIDAVLAAREGHIAFASCGSQDERRSCHLVGIDPSGQMTWERELDVAGTFLGNFRAWEGELLPEVVTVAPLEPEVGLMIDPESGEPMGDFPRTGTLRHYGFGEVLVVASPPDTDCRLHGYRISDGEQLWSVDDLCPGEEHLEPVPPRWAGTENVMYVEVVGDDQAESVLAVSTADGTVQELPARDVGRVTSQGLNIEDASAGDLLFRWRTTNVTAAHASTLEQRWQVEVPGLRVRTVGGDRETVTIVSDAAASEHNPWVPPLPDDTDRGMLEYPTYVTVVDAETGEILSTTLVPEGVSDVQALPGQRALVTTYEGMVLVGAA